VQWKQGVVAYVMSCTVSLHDATPIHGTPLPTAPPFAGYPGAAVLCGAVSTFLGVMLLGLSKSYVFRALFQASRVDGRVPICDSGSLTRQPGLLLPLLIIILNNSNQRHDSKSYVFRALFQASGF